MKFNYYCIRARSNDLNIINEMKRNFYKNLGEDVPYNPRQPEVWMVCVDEGGSVVGCYSYTDELLLGQRWFEDFYRIESRDGLKAAMVMQAQAYNDAVEIGLDPLYISHPKNTQWTKVIDSWGSDILGTIRRMPAPKHAMIEIKGD